MNVVIINPLWTRRAVLPLNLTELAGYIRAKSNFTISLIDLNFELYGEDNPYLFIEKATSLIRSFKPDVIGLSCNTIHVPFCAELSKNLKATGKEPVVIGGIHGSSVPDRFLRLSHADYIVRGEGEETFLDLLSALDKGQDPHEIAGCSFINTSQEYVHNADRALIPDLDSFPLPAFDLISDYIDNAKKEKRHLELAYMATRGCSYSCTFCSSNQFWKYQRRKSVNRVIEELKRLLSYTETNDVNFFDDCLTLHKKWFQKLLDQVADLGIMWSFSSRVDTIDQSQLPAIYKAGCRRIYHGLESGSPRIRSILGKKFKTGTTNKSIIDLAREEIRHGITPIMSFMTGIPSETDTEMKETCNLALQLKKTGAKIQYWIMTPYPDIKVVQQHQTEIVYYNRWKHLRQFDLSGPEQHYLYQAFFDKREYRQENPDFALFRNNVDLPEFIDTYKKARKEIIGDVIEKSKLGPHFYFKKGRIFYSFDNSQIELDQDAKHNGNNSSYIVITSTEQFKNLKILSQIDSIKTLFISLQLPDNKLKSKDISLIRKLLNRFITTGVSIIFTRPVTSSFADTVTNTYKRNISIPANCRQCLEMFHVLDSGQIEFCNGIKALHAEYVSGRFQLYHLFNTMGADFLPVSDHCSFYPPKKVLKYRSNCSKKAMLHYWKGYKFFESLKYELTIDELKKALRLGYTEWFVYFYLGIAYINTNDFVNAIRNLVKAEQKNRIDPRIDFKLAAAFKSSGNLDKTFFYVRRAMKKAQNFH